MTGEWRSEWGKCWKGKWKYLLKSWKEQSMASKWIPAGQILWRVAEFLKKNCNSFPINNYNQIELLIPSSSIVFIALNNQIIQIYNNYNIIEILSEYYLNIMILCNHRCRQHSSTLFGILILRDNRHQTGSGKRHRTSRLSLAKKAQASTKVRSLPWTRYHSHTYTLTLIYLNASKSIHTHKQISIYVCVYVCDYYINVYANLFMKCCKSERQCGIWLGSQAEEAKRQDKCPRRDRECVMLLKCCRNNLHILGIPLITAWTPMSIPLPFKRHPSLYVIFRLAYVPLAAYVAFISQQKCTKTSAFTNIYTPKCVRINP